MDCAAMLALVLSQSALAAGPEPIVLEPSANWTMNYSNDSCRLSRAFGTGDNKLVLALDRFEPGDPFMLTLAGPALTRPASGGSLAANLADIRFGPTEGMRKIEFARAKTADGIPAWVFIMARLAPYSAAEQTRIDRETENWDRYNVDPIGQDRQAAVEYVDIGAPLAGTIRLHTGSLGPPFAAFDTCLEELMTHWGIDVEQHRHLQRKPSPKLAPSKLWRLQDYPTRLLEQNVSGLVQFRLAIDATGNVTNCTIQQSTRPAAFDKAVCKSLSKVKFEPALDQTGHPIASYWRNSVRFSTQ